MPKINIGSDNAVEIDRKKRALELKSAKDLKKIFSNMADDAASLYLASGTINAKELAENYKLEFTKEIRDIMRKTLKIFGFSIRDTLQKKSGFFFDLENKFLEIDLDFKRVVELEEVTDSQIDKINRDFLLASALFVANESEKQSALMTETSEREIGAAFVAASSFYTAQLNKARERQQQLQARAILNEEAAQEARKVGQEIQKMEAAKQNIIATAAKTNLKEKSAARSELIAEQNVGLTESWSRQKEAELVNDAELITTAQKVIKLEKEWQSILDSKVRIFHADADGQTVAADQPFTVGGEQLMAPRMGQIPSNNIRCRCSAAYKII